MFLYLYIVASISSALYLAKDLSITKIYVLTILPNNTHKIISYYYCRKFQILVGFVGSTRNGMASDS